MESGKLLLRVKILGRLGYEGLGQRCEFRMGEKDVVFGWGELYSAEFEPLSVIIGEPRISSAWEWLMEGRFIFMPLSWEKISEN
jgi:hypothetical protein